MKPKKTLKANKNLDKNIEFIDEIHKQSMFFIDLAKDYYKSSLLKCQVKILIELGPNNNNYSSALKTTIFKNYFKKATLFHSQKIPFMLLNFKNNVSPTSFERSENKKQKSEQNIIDQPIGEKIGKEEKNDKKRDNMENKEIFDFFYLLLENCLKIWEEVLHIFFVFFY